MMGNMICESIGIGGGHLETNSYTLPSFRLKTTDNFFFLGGQCHTIPARGQYHSHAQLFHLEQISLWPQGLNFDTPNSSSCSIVAPNFCSKTHLAVKKPCCGFPISVYMNISLKSSLCTYVDVYILWIPPCVDVYMCIYMVYSICHVYIAVCM